MAKEESIKFISRQQPSTVLPQNGGGALFNPLAEKAVARATNSLVKLQQAANGERPVLGGHSKGEKWLLGQITEMSKDGYLPEEPSKYFTIPQKEIAMGYNPTSHFLIQEKQALLSELGDASKGLHVAGTDIALRSKGEIQRKRDDARMVVALPGDLNTLQEMLELITKKLNGEAIDQPLIIENSSHNGESHYWDEILRSIKILDKNLRVGVDQLDQRAYVNLDALAHHYGIYITEQRDATVDTIKELDKKISRQEIGSNEKPVIPEGAIFFVATGTMKKYDELSRIFKQQGVNARIRPIFELVDTYVSPKELSGTYEGNVAEKAHAALDAWHQMDEKTRVERLDHLGIKKEQAFIIAEDSGFHFKEPGLVMEDQFGDIRDKLDVNAPFPGVETGPGTIGSNGIGNFMEKVHQIFSRRHHPNADVVAKSLLAITPLDQPQYGKQKLYMVGAETTGKFTFRPQPANGTIEIANYLVPHPTTGLPRGQTEAQLGDRFALHHSARAIAWKGLASELGVTNGKHEVLENDYSKEFAVGIVTDDTSHAARHRAQELEKEAHDNGFGVVKLGANIDKAKDPQDKIFSKSDAVVFAFDPETAKDEFWRNIYMLTSAIVGEQTHDKFKFLKPTYIVNPNGAFDNLMEFVYDFHHLGTVPEDPETLIKQVKTVDEAVERLKEDRKSYRRYHVPGYATREEAFDVEGTPSKKDFNVGIFMSASSENGKFKDDTKRLVTALAKENMGVITGGGMFGPMGVATKVLDGMRSSHRSFHGASNVPHIMSGEGDARDNVQQFQLARDIYERMEYMLDKSDAFIITPGGTGTVQELALLAMLKKRSINSDDEYAKKKMEGKDIVIVNTKIDHMANDRGFYDKLLEIIPEGELEKLGIHVVDTVQEAKEKMVELRVRKLGHGANDNAMNQSQQAQL